MQGLQRDAVILALVERLNAVESWCGETHVQKSAYFLQELLRVPLALDFILYKHGPYSFDLSDELGAMRANAFLALELKLYPYGPSIVPGSADAPVKRLYAKTIARYSLEIAFVAERLGRMTVAELERVATALYVTRDPNVVSGIEARAQRIHELKPHVTLEAAREAVKLVDCFIAEARELQAAG